MIIWPNGLGVPTTHRSTSHPKTRMANGCLAGGEEKQMTSIVALPQRGSDLLEPFLSAQMRDATRTAYRADLIEFFGIDWITEAHVKGT